MPLAILDGILRKLSIRANLNVNALEKEGVDDLQILSSLTLFVAQRFCCQASIVLVLR